jgi:hypothetical protein
MRTTLTLDDDLARQIKRLQHRSQLSFKETVDLVLRRGLGLTEPALSNPAFEVEPFDGGFAPGIDAEKLNQFLDELDVEEALAESAR